jgi:hypothetical protein
MFPRDAPIIKKDGSTLRFRTGLLMRGRVMRKYYVKGPQDRIEYFEIVGDTTDSYLVRLTRIVDGDKKVLDERISHDLFEICLKTGYIYQVAGASGKNTLTKVA